MRSAKHLSIPAKITQCHVKNQRHSTIWICQNSSLFTWALTIRACEFELEKDHTEEQKELLRKIHAECEKEFAQRAEVAERDINYEVTPIKKLVSIQLECGMILADYLNPKTK